MTPAPPALPSEAPAPRRWLTPMTVLLGVVPVAVGLRVAGGEGLWLFVASGVAIVPLAGLMGHATETIGERLGAGVGGLLNATFGNAAELIIALMVLRQGPDLYPLVKASITGSIIGNLLLVLGLALLAGGVRRPRQTFNRTAAGVGTTLMALACVGLAVPSLFYYVYHAAPHAGAADPGNVEGLSREIAVVLAVAYGLSLLFSLRTHPQLYAGGAGPADEAGPSGSTRAAILTLVAATAGVVVLSEWLSDAVRPAAAALGMNTVFVGVIVVAVIGNAAEHSTAVLMAWKDHADLAVQIAVGSSTQVALFVAPVLVFASSLMGLPRPLDLHFTPMEVAALILSVAAIALVCHDGESNWLEGALLLAVYVIFGLAFYHLPAPVSP